MFAVPFGYEKFEGSESVNAELAALFRKCAADGNHYVHPRALPNRDRRVFESVPTVFRWPDDATRRLKEFCLNSVLRMVGTLNGYDDARLGSLQVFTESWFQILQRGGFLELRNHPMASWSGVYCVDPGKDDPDKPTSGMLGFLNPSKTSAMYVDPSVANLQPPYNYGLADIKIEAGQLVLFPSWLLHDVRPYEGEGERITVAFNVWFAPPAAPSPAA